MTIKHHIHNIIHCTIALLMSPAPTAPKTSSKSFCRPKPQSAIDACGRYLSVVSWDEVLNEPDVDRKYQVFLSLTQPIYNKFFPLREILIPSNCKLWMTQGILDLLKEKKKLWSKHPESTKEIHSRICTQIKKAKLEYFNRKVRPLAKTNPYQWHKELGKFVGIADPKNPASYQFSADDLNRYFAALNSTTPPLSRDQIPVNLNNKVLISFPYHEVATWLKEIDTRKSQPQNDVPAVLLKQFYVEMAEVVADVLNCSYLSAQVTIAWSTTEVTPLPKISNPVVKQDFRPISKLPVLCRLLEKRIAMKILNLAVAKRAISSSQFGAAKGRSTTLYLVSLFDKISRIVDLPRLIAILATLDIKKAFNSTSHSIIYNKLLELQLPDQDLAWVLSLLINFTQYVQQGGVRSTTNLPFLLASRKGLPLATFFFALSSTVVSVGSPFYLCHCP